MAAVGYQVTVTTAATKIFEVIDAVSYPASPSAVQFKAGNANDPLPFMIMIPSGVTVYLGGSTVTSSGGGIGAALPGPAIFSYNAVGDDSLYGIVNAGTAVVSVLVQRQ